MNYGRFRVNTKPTDNPPEYDPELLRMYLRMSPAQRLKRMYELNKFFWEAMPDKNKRSWEKLKAQGF